MTRGWPERALDGLPVGLAAWVGGNVATYAARFGHRWDLEWMEGGMLSHAWRLQRGLPLYVEPSAEFIPFIYPPGYSALLAAAGALGGLDYPTGRALSLLGVALACAAILWLSVRHVSSWALGVVGAAVYLGCFRASGGFHDLVRPDSVSLALLAWSVVLAAERRRGAEIASGLLLCAAFLVKHSAALYGVPIALALWIGPGWRVAARFGAASAGPALAMTALLQWRSEGRFLTYLLDVPGAHPMLWDRFSAGAPGELAQWLLPATLGAVGGLVLTLPARAPVVAVALASGLLGGAGAAAGALQPSINGIPMAPPPAVGAFLALVGVGLGAALVVAAVARRDVDWRWWLAFGVGACALASAGLMRAHFGGFMNVLMPAHWALAAGLALGVGAVRLRFPGPPAAGLTMLVLVGQLGWIQREHELDEVIPDPSLDEAGLALVELLGDKCDGPILAPHFAWVPTRLGQPPSLHLIALWDLNHEGGPYRDHIGVVADAAKQHHWACVLEGQRQRIGYGVEPRYRLDGPIPAPARNLVPQTGWRVRPSELYVRPEDP